MYWENRKITPLKYQPLYIFYQKVLYPKSPTRSTWKTVHNKVHTKQKYNILNIYKTNEFLSTLRSESKILIVIFETHIMLYVYLFVFRVFWKSTYKNEEKIREHKCIVKYTTIICLYNTSCPTQCILNIIIINRYSFR